MDRYEGRWESVPDFPRYAVSPSGEVLDVKTRRILTKRTLKGIAIVDLQHNGSSRPRSVPRLMLSALVRPPKRGEQARFIDGNKENLTIENLEWEHISDRQKRLGR